MKATELRIGNWVEIQGIQLSQVVGQVTRINGKKIGRNLQPIPLTEEWLERFGFEKPAHSWCGDKFHLSNWDKYPDCWCVALNKNNAILVDKLKHVHQLQNLYYALTNSELTLND